MYWALSDYIKRIGTMFKVEESCAEYDIAYDSLPNGESGLWNFTAIRNIEVAPRDFLGLTVTGASLYISGQLVEHIDALDSEEDLVFKTLQSEMFLPFFVLESETLTVKVHFLESVNESMVPRVALRAEGLLVKVKHTSKPFMVACSDTALVSWDGHQCHVFQPKGQDKTSMVKNAELQAKQDSILNSMNQKDPKDLWNALPLENN
jgi:hypothetical protein